MTDGGVWQIDEEDGLPKFLFRGAWLPMFRELASKFEAAIGARDLLPRDRANLAKLVYALRRMPYATADVGIDVIGKDRATERSITHLRLSSDELALRLTDFVDIGGFREAENSCVLSVERDDQVSSEFIVREDSLLREFRDAVLALIDGIHDLQDIVTVTDDRDRFDWEQCPEERDIFGDPSDGRQ